MTLIIKHFIPHTTLHTKQYTLFITHFKLHTAHYTLHTTHYTLHTTHYTLHTVNYTLHNRPARTCCSLTSLLHLRRVESSDSGLYSCSPAALHNQVTHNFQFFFLNFDIYLRVQINPWGPFEILTKRSFHQKSLQLKYFSCLTKFVKYLICPCVYNVLQTLAKPGAALKHHCYLLTDPPRIALRRRDA